MTSTATINRETPTINTNNNGSLTAPPAAQPINPIPNPNTAVKVEGCSCNLFKDWSQGVGWLGVGLSASSSLSTYLIGGCIPGSNVIATLALGSAVCHVIDVGCLTKYIPLKSLESQAASIARTTDTLAQTTGIVKNQNAVLTEIVVHSDAQLKERARIIERGEQLIEMEQAPNQELVKQLKATEEAYRKLTEEHELLKQRLEELTAKLAQAAPKLDLFVRNVAELGDTESRLQASRSELAKQIEELDEENEDCAQGSAEIQRTLAVIQEELQQSDTEQHQQQQEMTQSMQEVQKINNIDKQVTLDLTELEALRAAVGADRAEFKAFVKKQDGPLH